LNTDGVQLKNRITKHYGYVFNAKTLNVDQPNEQTKQLPKWSLELVNKFTDHQKLVKEMNQLTINEYQSKTGISGHVDTHSVFDENIIIISLRSDVTIKFVNSITKEVVNLWVPRRSGLIMSGESRYLWTHRISFRASDVSPDGELLLRGSRISLTFRKVLDPSICKCKYPLLCDTQNPASIKKPNRLGNYFADKTNDIY
jgi:alkylated DNA repair protein alkB family protein 8